MTSIASANGESIVRGYEIIGNLVQSKTNAKVTRTTVPKPFQLPYHTIIADRLFAEQSTRNIAKFTRNRDKIIRDHSRNEKVGRVPRFIDSKRKYASRLRELVSWCRLIISTEYSVQNEQMLSHRHQIWSPFDHYTQRYASTIFALLYHFPVNRIRFLANRLMAI